MVLSFIIFIIIIINKIINIIICINIFLLLIEIEREYLSKNNQRFYTTETKDKKKMATN